MSDLNTGDRVLITGTHPWRGYTGEVIRMMRLSPITTEQGWRIELDNGLSTVAREDILEKINA